MKKTVKLIWENLKLKRDVFRKKAKLRKIEDTTINVLTLLMAAEIDKKNSEDYWETIIRLAKPYIGGILDLNELSKLAKTLKEENPNE